MIFRSGLSVTASHIRFLTSVSSIGIAILLRPGLLCASSMIYLRILPARSACFDASGGIGEESLINDETGENTKV